MKLFVFFAVSLTFFYVTGSSSITDQQFRSQVADGGKILTKDALDGYSCDRHPNLPNFSVRDPQRCDRYFECRAGSGVIKTCVKGMVFSTNLLKCVDPKFYDGCDDPEADIVPKVATRPSWVDDRCPSAEGRFLLEESCTSYGNCHRGQYREFQCALGTVFAGDVCVHPSQSGRADCTDEDVHGFSCPRHYAEYFWGDHNREPHPTDCKHFFVCLRKDGSAQLNTCRKPLVYDREAEVCVHYSQVKGCEDYYAAEE